MQYGEVNQPNGGLQCDKCKTDIANGEMAYSCVPCDLDVCLRCAHNTERRRKPRKVF